MRHRLCLYLLLAVAVPVWAALDLNKASEADLDALPGVGPARARAIVEYRSAHGPFRSVDELGNVKGIGARTLADLKPLLAVQAQPEGEAGHVRPPVTPEVPSSPEARSAGIPWMWWMLAAAVIVLFAGIVLLRARRAGSAASDLRSSARAAESAREQPAAPAAAENSSAAARGPVPPRPAGSVPKPAGAASSTVEGVASAPRPAGGPPKPAGQP